MVNSKFNQSGLEFGRHALNFRHRARGRHGARSSRRTHLVPAANCARPAYSDVMDPASQPPTQLSGEDGVRARAIVEPTNESVGTTDGVPSANVNPPPPLTGFVGVAPGSHGPSHRDRVWTFLWKSNREVLRDICRDINAVQRGTKAMMA